MAANGKDWEKFDLDPTDEVEVKGVHHAAQRL